MEIQRRRGGLDVVRKKENSEKRADHRYVSPDTGPDGGKQVENWGIGRLGMGSQDGMIF